MCMYQQCKQYSNIEYHFWVIHWSIFLYPILTHCMSTRSKQARAANHVRNFLQRVSPLWLVLVLGARKPTDTLTMVNTEGHTMGLFPHYKHWGLILRVNSIYQPTVFNIRGPHCRLPYFYWIEYRVHLYRLPPYGRWYITGGMINVTRVAYYFLAWRWILWTSL